MPIGEKTKLLWKNLEYKKMMSEAHLGKFNNLKKHWKIKDKSKMFGHKCHTQKHTIEAKLKMKNNARWKELHAWNYIEDRTKLAKNEHKNLDGQYKDWMLVIKNRDKWQCKTTDENCKGRLEAHHIFNWHDYPKLRYDINNGITLCHAHHPRGREREAKLSPFFRGLVTEEKYFGSNI